MSTLEINIDFLQKRIVEQNEYICKTFIRYDNGEISEQRCRELVDSAVAIRERFKNELELLELSENGILFIGDLYPPVATTLKYKLICKVKLIKLSEVVENLCDRVQRGVDLSAASNSKSKILLPVNSGG